MHSRKKSFSNDSRGGSIYEYYAANLLSDEHNLLMDQYSVRGKKENSIRYFFRLFFDRIDGDIFIKSPSVINHGILKKTKINIGILHHIYLKQKNKSF